MKSLEQILDSREVAEKDDKMKKIEQTITSLEVAEMVDKDHNMLLRDIRRYDEQLGQSKIAQSDFFTESTYKNSQNKTMPCYLVTKKGCEFIAHKLTGVKGTEFTAKYINRFHDMEEQIQNPYDGISTELQAVIVVDKRVTQVENRIEKLENTMNIDYGQQQILKDKVNKTVIKWLGGKESNAYKEISKKVFSECNRDFQRYFSVNSRNNTPRCKFDEAILYVEQWEPCNNTKLLIKDCNAQLNMEVA